MRLEDISQAASMFIEASPLNIVKELNNMQIFDMPLIGAAAANDPLFERYKEPSIIGPHHKSPREWLAEGRTVISYFLPFSAAVRIANRQPGATAPEWLYGRIEGEKLNNAVCRFLIDILAKAGYKAIAPSLDGRFAVINRRSNWSERHAAFAAGLGTFSLNCSLITSRGAAGRLGSVITDLFLEPTPRPYKERDENCTKCGACILRCPPQAVDEHGKNHELCSQYLDQVRAKHAPRYGCGKCQTGVPCEERIPVRN